MNIYRRKLIRGASLGVVFAGTAGWILADTLGSIPLLSPLLKRPKQPAIPHPNALTAEPSPTAPSPIPSPTPSPTSTPTATSFIKITDAGSSDPDGPTWEFANRPLQAWWKNGGGDYRDKNDIAQGPSHYASATINAAGDVSMDITALATRLLSRNTGLYVAQTAGNVKFAARNHPTNPGPRLHIVTSSGTFNPPCIVDTWTHPSANSPMGDQTEFDTPGLVRFELSGITGTVTSATLTLNAVRTFVLPCTIAVDYLDCPSLDVDLTQVVQGIAATVAEDKALVTHPDVLLYDNLISKDYVKTQFQGQAGGAADIDNLCQIIDWPQYGLKAARVWSTTTNQRIISWHHWAEPKQSPSKPWQRDFGDGHTHLFVRYLLTVGEDVQAGMTENGMKLPGMTGTYDWSTSGAVTQPQPSGYGTWEGRLYHSAFSTANPGRVHLGTYFYGVRNPDGTENTVALHDHEGNLAMKQWWTSAYLKAGTVHCIEQEVKINTLRANDQTPDLATALANANADGIMRIWLDGVPVYEATTVSQRGYDQVRIQSIPFVDIYHGGLGYPSAPFHFDIGGICVATKYIGPPKVVGTAVLIPAVPPGGSSATPTPTSTTTTHGSTSNPTPVTGPSTLGTLAASLMPGQWAELVSENINSVIGVGNVTQVAIPYANSAPWDPINRRIKMVCGDHGYNPPGHQEYDDLTDGWTVIDRTNNIGSHLYQHCTVNPFTGDLYLRNSTSTAVLRFTPNGWVTAFTINDISEVASVACVWVQPGFAGAGAQGALAVYSGNFGSVYICDPLTGRVTAHEGMLPGIIGYYHVVSAFSARKNCLVYGGGNPGSGPDNFGNVVYRMNADGSKTRMPDTPNGVSWIPSGGIGIYKGNLICDPVSGNFLMWGYGQFWELNPDGAGTWTQLPVPTVPLLDQTLTVAPGSTTANSTISVACETHGVVLYIDAWKERTPICRMWMYKHT